MGPFQLRTPCTGATIVLLICGLIFFHIFSDPTSLEKPGPAIDFAPDSLKHLDFWKKITQSDLIFCYCTPTFFYYHHYFVFDTNFPCGFWFNTNYFRQKTMQTTFNSWYFCCFTEKLSDINLKTETFGKQSP